MKCCFCNQGIDEGKTLIPIEPRGTKNRKWACLDCIPDKVKKDISEDVKEICSIFDDKFKEI